MGEVEETMDVSFSASVAERLQFSGANKRRATTLGEAGT